MDLEFAGTGWTEGERQYLIRQMLAGRRVSTIAETMGRSEMAINSKILQLRHGGILAARQSTQYAN